MDPTFFPTPAEFRKWLERHHDTSIRPDSRRSRRTDDRSAIYSYEQRRAATLDPAYEQQFRHSGKAWELFQSKPPSYRRAAIHWVMSAKREETRKRRLTTLIDETARGGTVGPLTPRTRKD